MEIKIHYQDENLIIVEKPAGLLVHAYKKETNEKENLMRYLKAQTGYYLYPVHRLDRPVSGLVIFALNPETVRFLQQYWHTPDFIKEYIALVKGHITEKGRFQFSLKNEQGFLEEAVTHYEPEETFEESTLVKVRIETGRKHQIRRHFSRRCHNIIGDTKYGQGKVNRTFREQYHLNRIFLHARYLKIPLPDRDQPLEIHSPLPENLSSVLALLQTGSE